MSETQFPDLTVERILNQDGKLGAVVARWRAVIAIPVGAIAFGIWLHSWCAGIAFGMFLEVLNDLREGK